MSLVGAAAQMLLTFTRHLPFHQTRQRYIPVVTRVLAVLKTQQRKAV